MQIIKESDKNAVDIAYEFLRAGKIISFAADTVYGLAVDASNSKAIDDLYKVKNRDEKKPIAIFVKDLEAAKNIFFFDEQATKIAEKFLPGSLTLVLQKNPKASLFLAQNLNNKDDEFLGFRIVDREFIKKLLEKFDGNLAVTSANPSSLESAIRAEEVIKYFQNSKVNLLIDGGECVLKVASTVIKIFNKKITVLRQGLINISNL